MGGTKEATVPKSKSSKSSGQTTSGSVRIHENNGEVHFHDDVNKLKVAAPVAEYDQKWAECKHGMKPVSFIDGKNQTIATLTPKVDAGEIDVEIAVDKLSHSNTFNSLDNLGT